MYGGFAVIDVEARAREARAKRSLSHERDVVRAEAQRVLARDGERVGADVRREDLRGRALARHRDGDAAGARAEIERAHRHRDVRASARARRRRASRCRAAGRARAVDAEGQAVELALAAQVRDGSRARRRLTSSRKRASSPASSGRIGVDDDAHAVDRRARARGGARRRGAGSRSRARESRRSPTSRASRSSRSSCRCVTPCKLRALLGDDALDLARGSRRARPRCRPRSAARGSGPVFDARTRPHSAPCSPEARCARRRCRGRRCPRPCSARVTAATTSNLIASGQSTRSSGVVKVFGTSASISRERPRIASRGSRAGAATRRSRRRSRSSDRRRRGDRSSRRRGARLLSFIFVLMSECPVFQMMGWPPCFAMSS